jgi:tripartite-type tricarboxylate transporter receptor subunit TctC
MRLEASADFRKYLSFTEEVGDLEYIDGADTEIETGAVNDIVKPTEAVWALTKRVSRRPRRNSFLSSTMWLACALAAWGWNAPTARSAPATPEEFYRRNTIVLLVGTDASGEYDAMARLLMRHLSKHIPGNPNIVVENMPGASGIKAANYLYAAAPRDGSMMAIFNKSMPFYQVTKVPNTNYKSDEFNWIGTFTRSNNLVTVMARTGVKTVQDATRKEITMGSLGAGGTMSTYPLLLNHEFGTKFKLVQGYVGAQLVDLAMARGEVDGRGSYTWSDLKAAHADWIRDQTINVLVQFGYEREPDLPDVPTLIDLGRNDGERAVFRFVSSDIPIGRPFLMPPDVPMDRVEALRKAFGETVKDPEFLVDAKTVKVDVTPVSGADLQKIVTGIISTPSDIVQAAEQLMQYN